MQNKFFFPQAALDEWGIEGKADLSGSELIVLAEGRRYKVEEAVRVIAEVTGANEEHALVGKVKPKRALDEIGAEILEGSMILGDNAYDVVPGWMGAPTTSFADHLLSPERMAARGNRTDVGKALSSDEELISRFVEGTL
ncbi:MAG: hypothetical protein KF819_27555 [Labilithrix sp.]|nr:hypothetical protein [Labilithrix sp.]